MSGIVGIVNLDGAPIDAVLLRRMTDSMAFRGPDRQAIWHRGNVGFGHATLHTTQESFAEAQPDSLDGRLWITADARIDGRDELRSNLAANGRHGLVTDIELILNSYDVWEEECLNHLLGDFAFAIWDERRRRLFCARDHLGLKPFYYAQAADCFIFSNTLDCLRGQVSKRLSDQAVGDFLLCGLNCQTSATTFNDIQRLPPGHCLIVDGAGTTHVKRYWSLPLDGCVDYKNASDYVDRFQELLRVSVADRLRTDHVAILMSGGLDSTSLAATAASIRSTQFPALDLSAHTIVYDQLMPCEERYYAGLVARDLAIPIHFLAADGYRLYERWEMAELYTPEPAHYPLLAIYYDHYRQVAAFSRVALCGDGGDPIFCPSRFHFVKLFKELRWLRIAKEVGAYAFSHGGKLPPLGFRSAVKRWLGLPQKAAAEFPAWFNPDFAARAGLSERWRELNRAPAPLHPRRAEAYQKLTAPFWAAHFESLDAGMTSQALEIRSPLFDVRLVTYLLAIPPLPWTVDKELLRVAMHGILPEAVRQRPKTPLAKDPVLEKLVRAESQWIDRYVPDGELSNYVSREKIPPVTGAGDHDRASYYLKLLPLALNFWLKYRAHPNSHGRRTNDGVSNLKTRQEAIPSPSTDCLR